MTGQKVLTSESELAILRLIAGVIYGSGSTPTAFGKSCGFSKNHVSAIFNGYQHVNVDQLDRLLDGLGVDLEALVKKALKSSSAGAETGEFTSQQEDPNICRVREMVEAMAVCPAVHTALLGQFEVLKLQIGDRIEAALAERKKASVTLT